MVMFSWFFALLIGAVTIGIVVIIAAVVSVAVRVIRGPAGTGGADDTRVVQEIYQGLQKMEERVEALETILFEKEKRQS